MTATSGRANRVTPEPTIEIVSPSQKRTNCFCPQIAENRGRRLRPIAEPSLPILERDGTGERTDTDSRRLRAPRRRRLLGRRDVRAARVRRRPDARVLYARRERPDLGRRDRDPRLSRRRSRTLANGRDGGARGPG